MTNNNTTYKNTAIGLIPSDWEVRKIKEIGEVSSGGTPDTSKTKYWNGDINWCTPTDITALKNKFLGNTKTKITEEGLKNSSAKILPPNSIIVCTRATIGKAAINTVPMSTNQGFKNIIPKNIDTDFLYYKIISEEHGLLRIASGSTFLEVSKTDFDNFHISLPPLPEQQKIASILSTWDNAIDNCKGIIEELKIRNKGLVQKLLTGKMRLKGFEGSKWKKVSFADIARINSETLPSKTSSDFSFYYIDLSRVKEGDFDFPIDKIDYEKSSPRARRIFKKGDVLMATVRPNLMGFGYVDFDTNEMICSTGFAVLEPKQIEDGKYIYYSLFSHKIQTQINSLITGSNYPAINSSDVENLNIPFSENLAERITIVNILDKATEELNHYQQKLETLQLQKKGLMQQLLTGKVRVRI